MRYAAILSLAFLSAGCGLELLGTAAISSGLQAETARRATGQMQQARETTSQISVESAIAAYRAEHGANPDSLQALVQDGYLPHLPTKPDGTPYGYDPSTGALLDAPMAGSAPKPAIPAQDIASLEALHGAITRYWQVTQAYPPSLQALVPTYITAIPKTTDGRDFLYDPRTAALSHPSQAWPAAPPQHAPQRQPVAGAGGPMGEAMTGLAIQQELNRMSNAGAGSAGTRTRERARSVQGGHDARNQKVMDSLGL